MDSYFRVTNKHWRALDYRQMRRTTREFSHWNLMIISIRSIRSITSEQTSWVCMFFLFYKDATDLPNWSRTRDSILHLTILLFIRNFSVVDESEEKVWWNNSEYFEQRLAAVFHSFLFFIFLMNQATWLIRKADICSLIHLTSSPHVYQIRASYPKLRGSDVFLVPNVKKSERFDRMEWGVVKDMVRKYQWTWEQDPPCKPRQSCQLNWSNMVRSEQWLISMQVWCKY